MVEWWTREVSEWDVGSRCAELQLKKHHELLFIFGLLRASSFHHVRYVEKCEEEDVHEFGCSICSRWLVCPIQIICGHRFCGFCLLNYLGKGACSHCPQCGVKVDSIDKLRFLSLLEDEFVLETLQLKLVHCRHFVVGCEWIGEREYLVRHLISKCKVIAYPRVISYSHIFNQLVHNLLCILMYVDAVRTLCLSW